MSQKIVIATQNAGKCREIETVLAPLALTLVSQKIYQVPEVEETGLTYIENALIKARHVSTYTNQAALADDSGLVVPALNGAPGIYSARYAGEPVDHGKNIEKLLQELQHTKDRRAYFYCVLVFIRHATDPTPIIAEGKWLGEIASAPCGKHGFGYDPIFFAPEENCCAAELTPELKNALSHRGKALRALMTQLTQID